MKLGNRYSYGFNDIDYPDEFNLFYDRLQDNQEVEIPAKFCYELRNAETAEIEYDLLPKYKDRFDFEWNTKNSVTYFLHYVQGKVFLSRLVKKPKFNTPIYANGKRIGGVQLVDINT